jgi:hypothetical protein
MLFECCHRGICVRSLAPLALLAVALTLSISPANANSDLTNTSGDGASIRTDIFGSIYISAYPGQDVIVNNQSFSQTIDLINKAKLDQQQLHQSVSNLKAQGSELSASLANISRNSVTAASSLSQSMSRLNALLENPYRFLPRSTCAVRSSPQVLPQEFKAFSVFRSANDTLYLVAAQGEQSELYRYSGDPVIGFVSAQLIPSSLVVSKVSSFRIGNSAFVVLPHFKSEESYNLFCEVLAFNEDKQRLDSHQNISAFGARGTSLFTAANGASYLMVSNYFSSLEESYVVHSFIMRFNPATRLFEHWQNITTQGAYVTEYFQIDQDTFLTIPNQHDGLTNGLLSSIFKLDLTTGFFGLNQSIATYGATHMKPWSRDSRQYISIVNGNGGYVDTYVFSPSADQFVNVSTGVRLYVTAPTGMDVVDISGRTYMVLACGTFARVYRWDDTKSRFEQTQQVTVSFDWLYPQFVAIGFDTYLVISKYIFKFCSGQFVLA